MSSSTGDFTLYPRPTRPTAGANDLFPRWGVSQRVPDRARRERDLAFVAVWFRRVPPSAWMRLTLAGLLLAACDSLPILWPIGCCAALILGVYSVEHPVVASLRGFAWAAMVGCAGAASTVLLTALAYSEHAWIPPELVSEMDEFLSLSFAHAKAIDTRYGVWMLLLLLAAIASVRFNKPGGVRLVIVGKALVSCVVVALTFQFSLDVQRRAHLSATTRFVHQDRSALMLEISNYHVDFNTLAKDLVLVPALTDAKRSVVIAVLELLAAMRADPSMLLPATQAILDEASSSNLLPPPTANDWPAPYGEAGQLLDPKVYAAVWDADHRNRAAMMRKSLPIVVRDEIGWLGSIDGSVLPEPIPVESRKQLAAARKSLTTGREQLRKLSLEHQAVEAQLVDAYRAVNQTFAEGLTTAFVQLGAASLFEESVKAVVSDLIVRAGLGEKTSAGIALIESRQARIAQTVRANAERIAAELAKNVRAKWRSAIASLPSPSWTQTRETAASAAIPDSRVGVLMPSASDPKWARQIINPLSGAIQELSNPVSLHFEPQHPSARKGKEYLEASSVTAPKDGWALMALMRLATLASQEGVASRSDFVAWVKDARGHRLGYEAWSSSQVRIAEMEQRMRTRAMYVREHVRMMSRKPPPRRVVRR